MTRVGTSSSHTQRALFPPGSPQSPIPSRALFATGFPSHTGRTGTTMRTRLPSHPGRTGNTLRNRPPSHTGRTGNTLRISTLTQGERATLCAEVPLPWENGQHSAQRYLHTMVSGLYAPHATTHHGTRAVCASCPLPTMVPGLYAPHASFSPWYPGSMRLMLLSLPYPGGVYPGYASHHTQVVYTRVMPPCVS